MLKYMGLKGPWLIRNPTYDEPLGPSLEVRVCRGCNGWMNRRFEMPATPLLQDLLAGRDRFLTSKQQERLAAWITKTLLMFDLIRECSDNPPPADYLWFRQNGRPLPGARVWIGRIGPAVVEPNPPGQERVPMRVPEPAGEVEPPQRERLSPSTYARQLRIGTVFIQSVRSRDGTYPLVLDHPWFGTYLNQIFPGRHRRLVWPPERIMDRHVVDILWSTFVASTAKG